MNTLPNPEQQWQGPAHVPWDARTETERRIGPTREPCELLPGGLANINIRVGSDRVLRIYRRDASVLGKEACMLRRGWESFRVPQVLATGQDFLLLEHIRHTSLDATREHGAAVGRALAEIHKVTFQSAGFLGPALSVQRPMPDVIGALHHYADSKLADSDVGLGHDLREAVSTHLKQQGDNLRAVAGDPVLLHGDFKASNLHWTHTGEVLVLDWEFAWSGPALMDVGQLLRWAPPRVFVESFADSYWDHGGELPHHWELLASAFDLFNLVGLLAGASPGSRRAEDIRTRILKTVSGAFGS